MSHASVPRSRRQARWTGFLAFAIAGIAAMALAAGPAQAFEDAYVTERGPAEGEDTMAFVQYLAVEPDGTVYLSDSNNNGGSNWARIRIFDSNLAGDSSIGTYGYGADQLRATRGVDVDAEGNLYVAQGSSNGPALKKFSPSGAVLGTMGTNTTSSNPAPGEFSSLGDVAVDEATGSVYVVDGNLNTITKFDANGDYVTRFGGTGTNPGQFNDIYGIGIAPDGNVHAVNWKFGTSGGAYVRDSRINEYTPEGAFVGAWGHDDTDRLADLAWTEDVEFDQNGFAYVTDSYAYVGAGEVPTDVVKVFDLDREMVYRFGNVAEEGEVGGWFLPSGIGLDDSGGVYVGDGGNGRVVKWQLNASPPQLTATAPESPSSSTSVSIIGTADPGATVDLFDNAECAGDPVASGSAADFADAGVAVTVEEDESATFWGRATSSNGGQSTCSTESITYTNQSAAPEAPVLTGTDPAGPANDNNPRIKGTAPEESTVDLFTNAQCSGAPVASGTSEELAGAGIAVTVADDSTTTFWGSTTNAAGTSGCSDSSVTYVEKSTQTHPDPDPDPGQECPTGQTGTPPNCTKPPQGGTASVSVGKVKTITVKAGKKGTLRVPVSNTGSAAATGVKVCAKVNPKKKRKAFKAGRCVSLGTVGAGARKVAKIKVRTTKKAKGKAKVRISVKSANGGSAGANARVKVRSAKKRR